jgi:hypothetical protein
MIALVMIQLTGMCPAYYEKRPVLPGRASPNLDDDHAWYRQIGPLSMNGTKNHAKDFALLGVE